MKKLLIPATLLLLVVMLVSPSCKKDKDPEPTKEQLLTRSGGWKLTAIMAGTTDIYSFYDACEKDNVLKLTQSSSSAVGNYTIDEGATKCDVDDPQTYDSGTWTLNDAKTVLTVVPTDPDADPIEATIETLTSDTFKIHYTIDDGGPVTITETYTGL